MIIKKVLFWTPRLLSGLITLFFLAFTLEGLDNWVDGLIHLILGLIILALTILAWRKPRVGGAIFMVIGACFLILIHEEWATSIIIGAVPFISGLLFYFSDRNQVK